MYYEQLAFANRQLAGLLRSGIPLEEGLQKFASDLKDRKLVGQFDALEKQLAQGVSLPKALENSTFPPFYKKLVSLGCQSNDLPEVLLMIADHYEKTAGLLLQIRGMLVYPLIVVVGACILSFSMDRMFAFTTPVMKSGFQEGEFDTSLATLGHFAPFVLMGISILFFVSIITPLFRRQMLRWVPGFKESVLARIGNGSSLLIKKGVPLAEALELIASLESGPFRMALQRWAADIRTGIAGIKNPGGCQSLPGLFVSFIQNSGENLALGFDEASLYYARRAKYRMEIGLYCFLPIITIALGFLVCAQGLGVIQLIIRYMESFFAFNS
ncbi:MAG: Type fimbrial assembly protein PilC [Verrucomicrobiales bacterium]|nr:Type fimbrial assembly protein PilC [Verrucomicrobiales bacterium]